jgi:hypothetical protein
MKKLRPENRAASISSCGVYRYHLSRTWGGVVLPFLMLNPSTADALKDDATIRKCMGFAHTLGYGGIEVINLFAYRSRDPEALLTPNIDLIGPEYDFHLAFVARNEMIVAAWGCDSTLKAPALRGRPAEVLRQIRAINPGIQIKCFGKTKSGAPRHPLMLSYSTPLVDFDPHPLA